MKLSNSSHRVSLRRQRGIGLFDLLLLVGGLFLSYGLATAAINRFHGGWGDEELKEIAARMVATARYAEQAGVRLVVPHDLDATIEKVAIGETVEKGPFRGQFYGVPKLDEKGKKRVRNFLRIEEGQLALATEIETLSDR